MEALQLARGPRPHLQGCTPINTLLMFCFTAYREQWIRNYRGKASVILPSLVSLSLSYKVLTLLLLDFVPSLRVSGKSNKWVPVLTWPLLSCAQMSATLWEPQLPHCRTRPGPQFPLFYHESISLAPSTGCFWCHSLAHSAGRKGKCSRSH